MNKASVSPNSKGKSKSLTKIASPGLLVFLNEKYPKNIPIAAIIAATKVFGKAKPLSKRDRMIKRLAGSQSQISTLTLIDIITIEQTHQRGKNLSNEAVKRVYQSYANSEGKLSFEYILKLAQSKGVTITQKMAKYIVKKYAKKNYLNVDDCFKINQRRSSKSISKSLGKDKKRLIIIYCNLVDPLQIQVSFFVSKIIKQSVGNDGLPCKIERQRQIRWIVFSQILWVLQHSPRHLLILHDALVFLIVLQSLSVVLVLIMTLRSGSWFSCSMRWKIINLNCILKGFVVIHIPTGLILEGFIVQLTVILKKRRLSGFYSCYWNILAELIVTILHHESFVLIAQLTLQRWGLLFRVAGLQRYTAVLKSYLLRIFFSHFAILMLLKLPKRHIPSLLLFSLFLHSRKIH